MENDLPEGEFDRDTVLSVPFELKGGWQLRYYQHRAIETTLEAISEDKINLLTLHRHRKDRYSLPNCLEIIQVWMEFNNFGKRKPRILFLADRNILADQAFNSFSHFEEEALIRIRPSEIRKKGHVPLNGSIFFTISKPLCRGRW